MRPPVVIVNPNSSGGQTRARWPRMESELRDALGPFQPLFTERPGHATELARTALAQGAELIIALGGDGTVNEVANGFVGGERGDAPAPPGAALAHLPAGTGGDFARSIDAPRALRDAALRIVEAAARPIDLGRLSYLDHDGRPAVRCFVNIGSFGISGLVDRYVNRSSKSFGGRAGFLLATARATLAYKNARVRVAIDDGEPEEQTVYVVAVANGRFFGGGMKVAPEARLDDGAFDVVTIGDVSTARLLFDFNRVYAGTHLTLPFVTSVRARRVHAESARGEEVLLDVDGEQPGRLPATFEILPSALHARF